MKIDLSKSKLNNKEQKLFKEDVYNILEKYPVLKSLDIMVKFSNRLKTAAGNVRLKAGKYTIRVSTKNVEAFGLENGLGTLRHEFAHIIDYLKNGKFSHGMDFKRICAGLNGKMNSRMAGTQFANCASDKFIRTPFKYEYLCPCGASFKRKGRIRKIYTQACAKCGTKVASMDVYKIN